MKKHIFYSLFAAFLLASPATQAQEKGLETIAVVDIQAIMKESSAAKDVRAQIDKRKADFQSEISKKEDDLRAEEKKLTEQRKVLEKDAFEKKAEEFKNKVGDVQRQVQTRSAQLAQASDKAAAQLQEAVLGIVSEIGKEKGFLIAVPSSQILYAKDGLNITPDVLERLNKKLPKIDVKIEDVSSKKDSKK